MFSNSKIRLLALVFFLSGCGGAQSINDSSNADATSNLRSPCDDGNSTACFRMGERYRIVERDSQTALTFYIKACDGGYITGCTNGGILLAKKGTPYSKEFKQARKMFDKACEARMFSNGDNGQGELEMARWQAINIGATDIILLFGYTFITPFKRI